MGTNWDLSPARVTRFWMRFLNRSQFGMDYVTIECTVTPEELREFLQSPAMILGNVSYLTINDVTHETIDVDAIVNAYAREQ